MVCEDKDGALGFRLSLGIKIDCLVIDRVLGYMWSVGIKVECGDKVGVWE